MKMKIDAKYITGCNFFKQARLQCESVCRLTAKKCQNCRNSQVEIKGNDDRRRPLWQLDHIRCDYFPIQSTSLVIFYIMVYLYTKGRIKSHIFGYIVLLH